MSKSGSSKGSGVTIHELGGRQVVVVGVVQGRRVVVVGRGVQGRWVVVGWVQGGLCVTGSGFRYELSVEGLQQVTQLSWVRPYQISGL